MNGVPDGWDLSERHFEQPAGTQSTESGGLGRVLSRMEGFVRRFVVLSADQLVAVALWVVHTHAFDAADCTPYLSLSSAEKQSGKTLLLEVLELLVARPWLTGRVTAAVLARKVDQEQPTLLLDRSDAAFGGPDDYKETLRGLLNSGYRRGGKVSVCFGQGASIGYRDLGTFCSKGDCRYWLVAGHRG